MKKLLTAISSVPLSLAIAAQVHAQNGATARLDRVGTASGLDNTNDLEGVIGSLINVMISVLGIVFLFLVLFAGFTWMTAGGEQEKVAKAKKLLINGVIGLILVLAALAISNFVFSALGDAGLAA